MLKKPSDNERKAYLRRLWAQANEVFGDRNVADWMVHAFVLFEFGEESTKDLSVVEYEELLSWLRWVQARMDMLPEVDFSFLTKEGNDDEVAAR